MNDTPIYDQLKREYQVRSMREAFAGLNDAFKNVSAVFALAAEVFAPFIRHAIEEERRRADMYAVLTNSMRPFPRQGYDAHIAVIDELSDRSRGLAQTNKSYPTSKPAWARRRTR